MSSELSFTLQIPEHLNPKGVVLRMAGTRQSLLVNLANLLQVLDYKDVSDAVTKWISRLGEDRFVNIPPDRRKTPGTGRPTTYDKWYAPEPTFYRILLQCGMPNADQFSDWVCGEVLPCIREHGCYPPPTAVVEPVEPCQSHPWIERIDASYWPFRYARERDWPNHFTVFEEMMPEILLIGDEIIREKLIPLISDLPDGSAGSCWAHYRDGQPWAQERAKDTKLQLFDQSGEAKLYPPWLYSRSELTEFVRWKQDVYLLEKLGSYLERKFITRALPDRRATPKQVVGVTTQSCQRLMNREPKLLGKLQKCKLQIGGPTQRELF